MAVIDSRSAGVLTPLETANTGEVETRLRLFVSAITGLDKTVVRERWYQKPATQPPFGSDWCAVGVVRVRSWGNPDFQGSKGDIEQPESGDVVSQRHQTFYCVATFYGPNAQENADLLRDGLGIPQNNSWFETQGLTVQNVDDEATHVPEFINQQWLDRYDLSFQIGRKLTRTFGVRTIANADFEIITEIGKLENG